MNALIWFLIVLLRSRTVLSEVLVRRQKNDALKLVFPGFSADSKKYLDLIRTA